MKAFIVTVISRAHSSGCESKGTSAYATLEEASAAIQKYIEGICVDYNWPEDWDADDFNGEPFPTRALGTVERLRELLDKNRGQEVVVWGPESNFCYLVPEEILIQETK